MNRAYELPSTDSTAPGTWTVTGPACRALCDKSYPARAGPPALPAQR
jgi:hypothetical protein